MAIIAWNRISGLELEDLWTRGYAGFLQISTGSIGKPSFMGW